MRITKVKVGKEDVVIKRNAKEGYLLVGSEEKRGNQVKAFIESKFQSFKMSVLNKTLEKNVPRVFIKDSKGKYTLENGKKVKDKKVEENYSKFKELFEYILGISKAPKTNFFSLNGIKAQEDLSIYFGHKFKSAAPLQYYESKEAKQSNIEKKSVNLLSLIYKAVADEKANSFEDMKVALQPYKELVDWYTANKQALLAKSIIQNNITYDDSSSLSASCTQSNRKQAMEIWKAAALTEAGINFNALETAFDLQGLVYTWKKVWNDEKKYTDEDVKQAKQWDQSKVREKG